MDVADKYRALALRCGAWLAEARRQGVQPGGAGGAGGGPSGGGAKPHQQPGAPAQQQSQASRGGSGGRTGRFYAVADDAGHPEVGGGS
jgi:hypothetical protein